jgi:hypothetical protein
MSHQGLGIGIPSTRGPSMTYNDRTESGDTSLLTTVMASLLALAAAGGMAFCLLYALWWLNKYWAPW